MSYLQFSSEAKNPHPIMAGGTSAIRKRLSELDQEWDIDRAVMVFYSGALFAQIARAIRKNTTKSLMYPLIQSSFLIIHATFGWSPPVPLLRKLGFRTRLEIQAERNQLSNALLREYEWERDDKQFSISEWDIYGSI